MKKIILGIFVLTAFSTINAQVYDINSFLELVRKNNKDILIANKELELSEENKREARSNALPQLDAQGKYNRNFKDAYMYVEMPNSETGELVNQKFKITYDNEFSFQTVLSQQIFNYTVFNAIKASKQYEKLSGYVFDATFQGVIAGSKKAFYMALLLEKVWDVNKTAEDNAKENYELVKNKFNNGLASQFELLQAEVTWKNYLPETTLSERNYEIALNAIKTLAGIPVEENINITGSFEKFFDDPEQMDMGAILTNRPDFNALTWERNLLETNIEVGKAGHYPTLYASLAYQYQSSANRWALDNENHFIIGGVTLSIPIFNGWNTTAKVQKAKIEVDKSELRIAKAKDDIYEEIKNINLRIDEAKNRVTSAETTMKSAKKAFEIAETSTNNGLATQLELKAARLANDQAQLNMIKAIYDYLAAYFDWELAVGMVK